MSDDPLMLVCAFRYCLTRHTYVTGDAVDWVKYWWPRLDDGTRQVIQRDLDEHIKKHEERDMACATTAIDMRGWLELAQWISGGRA